MDGVVVDADVVLGEDIALDAGVALSEAISTFVVLSSSCDGDRSASC